MSRLFSFVVIFMLSFQLSGQLVLTPDTMDISFPQDTAYYDIHMTVTNNYNGPVSFWWRLVKTDFPPAWTTQVCDLNTCYFEGVDKCPKNNPNSLAAGASSDAMYVKLNPHNTIGTTSMWFKIYSNSDLTNIVDSILINVVSLPTSQDEVLVREASVFPNPAKDHFTLSGESQAFRQMEIISAAGQLMGTWQVEPGKHYPISELHSGLYYIRLSGKNGQSIKTIRLHKE